MPSIVAVAPGLLTTVQDLGRPGFAPLGVSAAGAADPVALRIGNRLLGNPQGTPALEMTLIGGSFVAPQGATVTLTGGYVDARVNRNPVRMWSTIELARGEILETGALLSGARCYLCVRGGLNVREVLGSASTHALSEMGGVDGRCVRAWQSFAIAEPSAAAFRRIRRSVLEKLAPRKRLRVTPGPQYDWLSEGLPQDTYTVSPDSDRLGIRLTGKKVPISTDLPMITEGISLGAVQVPPSGQPIVLFVDAQTTGGYPVIANVISADLPSLGQLRPGDEISFEPVTIDEARKALFEQERLLAWEHIAW